MIVPEGGQKTPLKGPIADNNGQSSIDGQAPPPPYQTSTSTPAHIAQHFPANYRPEQRQSVLKRFLGAFVVAALIWLLFSLFIRSAVEVGKHDIVHRPPGGVDSPHVDKGRFNIPTGLEVEACNAWLPDSQPNSGHSHRSSSSYELPVDSKTIFLQSHDHQISVGGHVLIRTSSEISPKIVKVDVTVSYPDEELRDRATTCLLKRGSGEIGVGIFTEKRRIGGPWRGNLNFEVMVTLPEISGKPLQLHNFETNFSNFGQTVEAIAQLVDFESISLKSSNAPIDAKTISATSGSFESSNGAIRGVYNATSTLVLYTSNAPIEAAIGLQNDPRNHNTTSVTLRTSNGKIASEVSLFSPDNKEGSFDIVARTTNAPESVIVPIAPIDSNVKLSARTSNSAVYAELPLVYEGKFRLDSTLFMPKVEFDHDVEDPSGRRRTRHVQYVSIKKPTLEGSVWWGDSSSPHEEKGNVELKTSNSQAILKLLSH